MSWKNIMFIAIAFCMLQSAYSQKADKKADKPVTITGKVVNKDNMAIPGAVIYIDNIRTRNITGNNGSYKIKVSPSVINLGIRSSEYGTCKTPIDGKTTINFTLDGDNSKASINENEESVEDLANNVRKHSRSRGEKINTYNDIYQMIRGEVSGVVVSGRSIQIQQGHSFLGSSAPLFVVNGVIVTSIDHISPLDVRSIKVLKGSAASIYGIQGTNGVISIDLKNGSEIDK